MIRYIENETGVKIDETLEQKLQTYFNFLVEENEKYNLTAITDRAEVYEKHFADSMLGSVCIPQNASVCDIGSGAGFPSIPLKLLRGDISVTLVDSLEKRVNFQKTLCQKLDIAAECLHERAEDFAKTHRERFDVVTARAVAPLPILLEYTAAPAKQGGIVLAYKTDESEVPSAQNAAKTLGLKFEGAKNFTLPSGASRCLLVYRKVAPTPQKYPRGQNKPRKSPL